MCLCVSNSLCVSLQGCSCRTPTARSASSGFGRRTQDCTPAPLATSAAVSTPQPPSRSSVRQATFTHTGTHKHAQAPWHLNPTGTLYGVPRALGLEIPVALELESSRPERSDFHPLPCSRSSVVPASLLLNQIKSNQIPVAALFRINHFRGLQLASGVMMNGLIAERAVWHVRIQHVQE